MRVRLAILLSDWVVNGESIGFSGTTNSNADHGFQLKPSAVSVRVRRLVEEHDGGEKKLSVGIRRDMMGQLGQGCELVINL